MRIQGRTPETRRETTRNEGKRRDGKRARTTLVGRLDTPSVERGPLYSASFADWLQRKNLAHEIRSLIGCLLLLARCRLSSPRHAQLRADIRMRTRCIITAYT